MAAICFETKVDAKGDDGVLIFGATHLHGPQIRSGSFHQVALLS